MQQELLNYFSLPVLAIFSVVFFTLLSLFIYYISHRFFASSLIKSMQDNSLVYGSISSFSTILIAFMIIVLWQILLEARHSVDRESRALAKIILTDQALPPSVQHPLHAAIKNYIQLVVDEEWEMMRWGKSSPRAEEALDQIYDTLAEYNPKEGKESIFYQEIITYLNNASEARHDRLAKLKSIMPTSLFSIFILSLCLIILTNCLLDIKEKKSYFVYLIILNIFVGLNFAVILSLDYPFSGEISIDNQQFISLLRKIH